MIVGTRIIIWPNCVLKESSRPKKLVGKSAFRSILLQTVLVRAFCQYTIRSIWVLRSYHPRIVNYFQLKAFERITALVAKAEFECELEMFELLRINWRRCFNISRPTNGPFVSSASVASAGGENFLNFKFVKVFTLTQREILKRQSVGTTTTTVSLTELF